MLEKHQHDHAVRDFDGVIEIRSNPVPRYFAILFYGLVIWAVPFMGYYLFSGWSSAGEFEEKMGAHRQQLAQRAESAPAASAAAPADTEALRAEGAKLYAQNCAMCHGAAGQGGIGPALNSPDYIYGRDAEAVRESIARGRPNGMPGFGNQFSATQIEALVRYSLEL